MSSCTAPGVAYLYYLLNFYLEPIQRNRYCRNWQFYNIGVWHNEILIYYNFKITYVAPVCCKIAAAVYRLCKSSLGLLGLCMWILLVSYFLCFLIPNHIFLNKTWSRYGRTLLKRPIKCLKMVKNEKFAIVRVR